jgi:hypothetical protein
LPLLLWPPAARKKKLLHQQHPHQPPLQLLHPQLTLLLQLPQHLLQLPTHPHHPLLLLLTPPLLLPSPLPALPRSNSSASRKSRREAAFLCPSVFRVRPQPAAHQM